MDAMIMIYVIDIVVVEVVYSHFAYYYYYCRIYLDLISAFAGEGLG